MHLYIAVRGALDRINRWENDVSSKYLDYNTGQGIGALQIGLRPIRFYEAAFPEQEIENALKIIQPGQPWNDAYKKYIWALRKAMGLEDIPAYKVTPTPCCMRNFINRDFIDIMGIGIKKDAYKSKVEIKIPGKDGVEQV